MTANRRASLSRATTSPRSTSRWTSGLASPRSDRLISGDPCWRPSHVALLHLDLTVSATGDVDVDAHPPSRTSRSCSARLACPRRQRSISRSATRRCRWTSARPGGRRRRGPPLLRPHGEPEGQEYVVIGGAYAGSLTRHVFETLAHHAGHRPPHPGARRARPHHVVEAQFKAVARALRAAVAIDPRVTGIPSAKGSL